MQRYNIPTWMKPYIIRYIRENPINAIKQATSFIEIKRKKGEVTNKYVKLPNGMTFDMGFVNNILSLFYYGEERLSKMYAEWATEPVDYEHAEYKARFNELSKLSEKHVRAIRNLIQGLGIKPQAPSKEAIEVFDYISQIRDWDDRIIASGFIIKYSYAYPFGFVFYKVFYPASPEFMRSFGKVFINDTERSKWLEEEAERIIKEREESDQTLNLTRDILKKTFKSIQAEMVEAKKAGIEKEAKLLRDISVAYPFHTLEGIIPEIDAQKEVNQIINSRS